MFFNPALFHAAGANHTPDVRRMANLLQISSAFGRAMESIDRGRVVTALYPTLLARTAAGAATADLDNVIACAAEGYPFPTNLDRDTPVDGMTPTSQAQVVRAALAAGVSPDELAVQLADHARARATH